MTYLDSQALISEDGLYRYWLMRRLGNGSRTVAFVGLNPSTADATQDDPTIRRCVGFARAWGFDVLQMVNLNAFRATNPADLWKADDPVGPENRAHLQRILTTDAELVVAAWGANSLCYTANNLATWIRSLPNVRCLGMTRSESPRHPLYLPSNAELRPLV